MGLKTNAGLVEYAKVQLGQPYWYGTFGQVSTKSLLDAKTKQYPSHYTATRMTKYNSQLDRRVFDCVGLIKGYIWSETPTSAPKYNAAQDLSANGMLKACKEKGGIDTMPEIPGVLVFLPGHVGVYIGGGYVVEARGFSFGVVKTKIGERPWKNWGKCPFVEYSSGAKAAQSAADVVCRLGDKNGFVYAVKKQLAAAKALGIITQSVDDNNIFGNGTLLAVKQLQSRAEIAVDGVAGIKTVEALNRMIDGATAELRENTAAAMEALT